MEPRKITHYERVDLNPVQLKLYRLCLYGINTLTVEEQKLLTEEEKNMIISNHKEVQGRINYWKQRRTSDKVDNLMLTLFPNSKFVKKMVKAGTYTSKHHTNNLSFKDLGITQEKIIQKLIKWEILPKNFYQLS